MQFRHLRTVAAGASLLFAFACGGAAAEGSAAASTTPKPAERSPEPEPAPAEAPLAEPEPPISAPGPAADEPPAPPDTPRPASLQGADIKRAHLLTVLSGGVGRFLQRVRAEAHLVNGKFHGWRLVQLFGEDEVSAPKDAPLRPGDTVLRVNGQSIERPEQFKNVWDSLATASELVLHVERAGAQSDLRYRIVD